MLEFILSLFITTGGFSLQPSDTVGCAQFRSPELNACVLRWNDV